jgi:hypothetical protein
MEEEQLQHGFKLKRKYISSWQWVEFNVIEKPGFIIKKTNYFSSSV